MVDNEVDAKLYELKVAPKRMAPAGTMALVTFSMSIEDARKVASGNDGPFGAPIRLRIVKGGT